MNCPRCGVRAFISGFDPDYLECLFCSDVYIGPAVETREDHLLMHEDYQRAYRKGPRLGMPTKLYAE